MKNHKLNLAIVLNQNGKQSSAEQHANATANNRPSSNHTANMRMNMKPEINKKPALARLSTTTSDLLQASSSDWSTNDIKNTQNIKSDSTSDLRADRRRLILMVSLLIVALVVGFISLSSLILLPSFVSHQISKVSMSR